MLVPSPKQRILVKSLGIDPKGRKQHTKKIPPELLKVLKEVPERAPEAFVVTRGDGEMLSYEWYCRSLKRYCKDLGFPEIGTHGLRHSTSEFYIASGATCDDLMSLFAHSSTKVTDRYIHEKGTQLEKISNAVRLFTTEVSKVSKNPEPVH